MPALSNGDIAARLEEIAALLELQAASSYRVDAYRRAADYARRLERPLADILAEGGVPALVALPTIGHAIARTIRDLIDTGRSAMLDRLRGDGDAVSILASVPAIGPVLAERLRRELGIDSLEDLELAAHDGRLAALPGFGAKRLAAVRDTLATRLGQRRSRRSGAVRAPLPPVDDLLSVDREYRDRAAAGELPTIAPRRFNPAREAWLPILHATRGDRHYTALFSNTARAHELGRTHDWVVIYADGHDAEYQCTVVTTARGPFRGRRVVRGREAECYTLYQQRAARRGRVLVPPGDEISEA